MIGPVVNRLYNNGKRCNNTQGSEWRPESKPKNATAQRCYDKYLNMAAESFVDGDFVAAEYLYQHAEHYWRIQNEAAVKGSA